MEKIGKMSNTSSQPRTRSWQKRENPELRRLRSSKRWQELRERILTEHPLCYLCRRLGMAPRLATEVHHIMPAAEAVKRGGEEAFYELRNLVPLCSYHHDRNESAWRNGLAETLFPEADRLTEKEAAKCRE